MYVKIRKSTASTKEGDLIINISKMALIQELRKIICEETNVEVTKQRLYYKGKELIDDHKIMDYDIQLNDVIQLMEKAEEVVNKLLNNSDVNPKPAVSNGGKELDKAISKYYKIDDPIDALYYEYGSWLEARIVDILKKPDSEPTDENNEEPNILFRIKWDYGTDDDVTPDLSFNEIRPRARYTYKTGELSRGQTVLVNYNIEDPSTRGVWYDFKIKKIRSRNIKGTIVAGRDRAILENCTMKFTDEVMKIEKPLLLAERPEDYMSNLPPTRKNMYYCETCVDVLSKPCKDCGCSVCAGKDDADTILLCDECNDGYHIKCLDPPLVEVPSENEDWYCPSCKIDENEIVKAGDKLKFSNKKAKMASTKGASSSRDWGRGMACVGRTKECTIVPKNHFGPIPGIEVGTCWKFRLQVSEAGVHRPHVAGIHGRESDGAFSLILSGGYEDDVDDGFEFVYTGSGGRDLSGNKRVNDQSCDQTLTRMNKALALNCKAPLNKNGAEAENWKAGNPVRVIRNYKCSKHSEYGPKEGNRYDGIYKVVKYYPETGKSGYLVWKYVLRRDDPEPAPWEEDGRELEIIYPPGYLEALSKTNGKRKRSQSTSSEDEKPSSSKKQNTKTTMVAYKLNKKIQEAIENDGINKKLWDECGEYLNEGKQKFLSKVEELFMCVCCQEVVHLPVTLECKHNVCKYCLQRSFSANIYNCPYCRLELGKDFKIVVNEELSCALLNLFPGYEANRLV